MTIVDASDVQGECRCSPRTATASGLNGTWETPDVIRAFRSVTDLIRRASTAVPAYLERRHDDLGVALFVLPACLVGWLLLGLVLVVEWLAGVA